MTLTPLRLAVALALTAGTAAAQASTTILDTTTTSGLSNKTFAGTASWNYGSAFDGLDAVWQRHGHLQLDAELCRRL